MENRNNLGRQFTQRPNFGSTYPNTQYKGYSEEEGTPYGNPSSTRNPTMSNQPYHTGRYQGNNPDHSEDRLDDVKFHGGGTNQGNFREGSQYQGGVNQHGRITQYPSNLPEGSSQSYRNNNQYTGSQYQGGMKQYPVSPSQYQGGRNQYQGAPPQYQGGRYQYQGYPPQYQGGRNQYQGSPPQYQGGANQYQGPPPQYQGGANQYQGPPPQYQGGTNQYQGPIQNQRMNQYPGMASQPQNNPNQYQAVNQGNYTQSPQAQQTPQTEGSQLDDRDRINDLLVSEKHLTEEYNTSAFEATHPELQSTLKNFLNETHDNRETLQQLMEQRGWYKKDNADEQQISQAYNQFSNYKSQFPFND